MASKLTKGETTHNSEIFKITELSIQTTFNTLIHKLEERRDELLSELHEMRVRYFDEEETRMKHIKDLDQLISKLEEATIKQNLVVKLQDEQIQRVKREKQELQQPTPIPVFHFVQSNLEELQRQIVTFGTLQDINAHYGTKLHPVRSIGKRGRGNVEFDRPLGVTLDGKGNMFIADRHATNRIQLISLEGNFIREIGKGELSTPECIALYKNWMFVTDSRQNKVIKYNVQNYEIICKSDLQLDNPVGITVDDDEVFVADCDNDRIVVFISDLKFDREFGRLKKPTDVKVNLNKVFIANTGGSNSILVFSKLGEFINSIISLRDEIYLILLCFDKFDNILISDCSNKMIEIYSLEGQLVHRIECDYKPAGVAVTQDNSIVSVDCNGAKIHLY